MKGEKTFFHNFSEIQPNCSLSAPVRGERGNKDLPPGTRGGEIMKPDLHEIHKQHTFDSYCKKVIVHEASNGHRAISYRESWEVNMSSLPEEAMEQLAVYDDYPWEHTSFTVCGNVVIVKNDQLAAALEAMSEKDRSIILMYSFLEMCDKDIASELSMARRTLNTHRQKAYRLLTTLMGGEAVE